MVYDALEMEYRKIKVRKDPECAICGKNPTVTGLIDYEEFCGTVSDEAQQAAKGSTITAQELDGHAGRRRGLLPRRRPRAGRVRDRLDPGRDADPQGRHPRRTLSELPQDKPVVLYCKTGVRSAEALATLKGAGFADAEHVQGGVTAWANQVDTTLPVY